LSAVFPCFSLLNVCAALIAFHPAFLLKRLERLSFFQ